MNMALCFNVRFDDPHTGQAVVKVNRAHGAWGGEERDVPHFPFHKGGKFEMLMLIEHNEVKVAINGAHYTSFHLRSPLREINHLGISGDVHDHSVRVF